MLSLTTLISKSSAIYDGTQLSPHWIYRHHQVMGNALVAFTGEAKVSLEHMVDLEDVFKKAPIYSPRMLHFLGEWFLDSLEVGILLQHLLVSVVYETLLEKRVAPLSRRGNDIYFENRKFSVSIATRSPVSVLIHLGINIDTNGTPIPTSGLAELNLEPLAFAEECLGKFSRDAKIWSNAGLKFYRAD